MVSAIPLKKTLERYKYEIFTKERSAVKDPRNANKGAYSLTTGINAIANIAHAIKMESVRDSWEKYCVPSKPALCTKGAIKQRIAAGAIMKDL